MTTVAALGWGIMVFGCSSAGPSDQHGASLPAEVAGALDTLGQRIEPSLATVVQRNADADESLNLIARIVVDEGELFEIYEPSPGYILYSGVLANGASESGKFGRPPSSMQGLGAVWDHFADGVPMPETVAVAAKREASRFGDRVSASKTEALSVGASGGEAWHAVTRVSTDGEVANVGQSISGGWCDTVYPTRWYADCDAGWDFTDCLYNWTGGRTAWHSDAFDEVTSVCADIGLVVLKVSSDEGFGGQWTVGQSTARYQWHTDWSCISFWNDCPYVRADVLEAAGDVFHFHFLVESE